MIPAGKIGGIALIVLFELFSLVKTVAASLLLGALTGHFLFEGNTTAAWLFTFGYILIFGLSDLLKCGNIYYALTGRIPFHKS